MEGRSAGFGAVASLEGIATPIEVARAVMDKSEHSFLVGAGAQTFAVQQGFQLESNSALLGEASHRAYQEYVEQKTKPASHDTLGLIVQDTSMDLAVGVSSSGVAFKHPGRVGDSPLPGGGLYVDNDVGAACVTGDGDEILKHCPSFLAVHEMGAAGKTPTQACQAAVAAISRKCGQCEIGIIALNKKGEFGAATTVSEWTDVLTGRVYSGFPYAVYSEKDQVLETRVVHPCRT